jgi:hypothetical protein
MHPIGAMRVTFVSKRSPQLPAAHIVSAVTLCHRMNCADRGGVCEHIFLIVVKPDSGD